MNKCVCVVCGNIWEDKKLQSVCPKCTGQSICSYTDGELKSNEEYYGETVKNIQEGHKNKFTCGTCGAVLELYAEKEEFQCHSCFEGILHKDYQKPKETQGQQVKKYRLSHKLTQDQLALQLGITRSLLSLIELDKRELPKTSLVKFKAII